MSYTIGDAQVIASVVALLMLVVCFAFLHTVFTGSKTKQYRRSLADMYVAGKIRQLAKKDNISLNAELKVFMLFDKYKKKFFSDLDDSIEIDMKHKIDEESIDYLDLTETKK